MEAATPDSLILLDEVGAGTDPTEGSALGMSVLRRLAGRASLTMATTHHGRLKTLKTSDPRFENACVEFDDASLRPTYRHASSPNPSPNPSPSPNPNPSQALWLGLLQQLQQAWAPHGLGSALLVGCVDRLVP